MFASIIYVDDESLTLIAIGLGVLILLTAVSPMAPQRQETKYGKIFAGLAIAIVVGFALFVWIYVRSR